jgi:hypothetical protein
MPEISRFYGIVIKMYFNDHAPPHFHAKYQGKEAKFNIHTIEMIEGELPKNAKIMIEEWATLHKDELIANWERASKPGTLVKIDPLQ